MAQRRPGNRAGRLVVEHETALLVPRIDAALVVVGHDLDPPVAEQVPGRERAEHGAVMPLTDSAGAVGALTAGAAEQVHVCTGQPGSSEPSGR